MTFAVDFAARTDVGLVRSRNEDSGYAGPHLLAVADGMGGHAGGNVASSLVLARLAPLDGDSHGSDTALDILSAAIAEANASLAKEMEIDPELGGMGTTLTALMKAGSHALAVVHIGDSRAYMLRGETFAQITKDHSFVQTLVDSGRITQAEAENHPQRSLVTRVLTGSPDDEPDLSMREPRIGDRYLICSDGLSDYVAFDTIAEVISMGLTPRETTQRLVDLAMKSGAPDNVTCVIGDIVDSSRDVSLKPVIVGAAADRQTPGGTGRSPAEKAAALARAAVGGDEYDDDDSDLSGRRRRPWLRPLLLFVLLLAVLSGASYGGWRWTQTQFYVGQQDGKVAIYRGVPQVLGPFSLSGVEQRTDIMVSDLPEMWRTRLDGEIRTGDLAVAKARVQELQLVAERCRSGGTDISCRTGAS
ncbi:PP2C-family Ser/Thr phosphatase [Austwickia sp. TVS 96-490-7B]|uniref:PP2C family protein-serine/threonine phosphatase n=1 Tax=Austwickia sp. TVS 96-490-7B TaxID=2830843 RepID=UPI001C589EA9|nr:protein phosphatase 2C domain-containing protein [Austwickia sp. TVS 96-490-7B]MBW3084223.1 PP2C-family Ser/Thr phosphatase [Austwickia sp. TVS 96-490-7B]